MRAAKTLFWTLTTGFWAAVTALAWAAQADGAAAPVPAPPAVGAKAGASPASSGPLIAERRFDHEALARHNHGGDCWMAIDGVVYDLTAYLPLHPSAPSVLLPWCGKDATAVYLSKPGTGRPHSALADAMLPRFRVGALTGAATR